MEKDIFKNLKFRPINETDDLGELTELLHKAYKKIADRGFRYLATHQDVETTKRRIKKGECYVVLLKGKLVGTITYYRHKDKTGNSWYSQPFVSAYGQFAVDPEFQNLGIGGQLIDLAETLAQRDNAKEITIDTSEGATDLIRSYTKKGYRFVGFIQWEVTNYRSVMLNKKISGL